MATLQIFEHTLPISRDDVYGGHVNNDRYFSYIGATFRLWYDAMGLIQGSSEGPLMAHMSYDFLKEMTYPGSVVCRLAVVRVGRSSLEHAIEIRNAERQDEICGRGKAISVWFDRTSNQASPWPQAMIKKCWPLECTTRRTEED